MTPKNLIDELSEVGAAGACRKDQEDSNLHHLELYVSGCSRHSAAAVRAVQQICEEELEGVYRLKIVDILKNPAAARHADVVVTPTLIARTPLVETKSIGKSIHDPDRLRALLRLEKQVNETSSDGGKTDQEPSAKKVATTSAPEDRPFGLYIVENERHVSELIEPALMEMSLGYRWLGGVKEAFKVLLALDMDDLDVKPVVIVDMKCDQQVMRKLRAFVELNPGAFQLVLVDYEAAGFSDAEIGELGAAAFVKSPIDMNQLANKVQKLLRLGNRPCPYCGQALANAPRRPEPVKPQLRFALPEPASQRAGEPQHPTEPVTASARPTPTTLACETTPALSIFGQPIASDDDEESVEVVELSQVPESYGWDEAAEAEAEADPASPRADEPQQAADPDPAPTNQDPISVLDDTLVDPFAAKGEPGGEDPWVIDEGSEATAVDTEETSKVLQAAKAPSGGNKERGRGRKRGSQQGSGAVWRSLLD